MRPNPMETPASLNNEPTVDHVPASLLPAMVEGLKIVETLKDKGQTEELTRWLAHHPDLAGQLAQFLADESIVQGHLRRVLSIDANGSVVGKYELGEVL